MATSIPTLEPEVERRQRWARWRYELNTWGIIVAVAVAQLVAIVLIEPWASASTEVSGAMKEASLSERLRPPRGFTRRHQDDMRNVGTKGPTTLEGGE